MSEQNTTNVTEHEGEPVLGLPGHLPPGEFLRWRGCPDWRDLAVNGLHLRKLAIYFALLLVLRAGLLLTEGQALGAVLISSLGLAVLAAIALGLVAGYAWLVSRSTVYTITSQRVVIRSGVALPTSINLPFTEVQSADVRLRRDGHGDLPLGLAPGARVSWIILWPHVRPWHFGRLQPMMRSLPEAEGVAKKLAEALAEYHQQPAEAAPAPRVRRRDQDEFDLDSSELAEPATR